MSKKERIILSLVFTLINGLFIYLILNTTQVKITTAQCPALLNTVKYEFKQGDCEVMHETDLLQPSGVWLNKTYSCWTLETPIEEWCKVYPERCNKN